MIRQDRRTFLGAASIGFASSLCCSARAEETVFPIVDTHTHFYDPTRPEGVPWPGKNDKLLYRPVLPDEFARLSKPHKVTGTIVVEASPLLEDNQWLLDLAKKAPIIVGIVGRLSPGKDGFAKHLERFAEHRLFRGIRIGHDELKKGLSERTFLDDLKRLADADRTLDINGGPNLPMDVAALAKEIPRLRIVINHAANLRIDGKPPPDDWLQGMRGAANGPNVFCKVSALVEGTGRSDGTAPKDVEFYRPVLDALWNVFGSERLIYGSNWPVSARFASYATVLDIVWQYVSAKGKDAERRVLGANARTAYQWAAKE